MYRPAGECVVFRSEMVAFQPAGFKTTCVSHGIRSVCSSSLQHLGYSRVSNGLGMSSSTMCIHYADPVLGSSITSATASSRLCAGFSGFGILAS